MIIPRSALVLERSPMRRSLLTELLQELGFPVVIEALSQGNAWEWLSMSAFDALFVETSANADCELGFIRKLRGDRSGHFKAPIVVVSGDPRRTAIEGARDAGANGFLVRPFSRASLAVQVTRALNDQRAFIESDTFIGPDRRRWNDPRYRGPERRGAQPASFYLE